MASTPVPRVPRRRSFAGPIVLITLGIIFLLGNVGVLTWPRIFYWFAHYWPVLLIIWGVVKLLEYFQAQRAGYASQGIGAGGVFLLLFVVFFGMIATVAARHDWSQLRDGISINDNDVFSFFGNPYNFQEALEQPFTPGSRVEVNNDRGDISIVSWDEPRVKVVADKRVVANNENEAQRIHERVKPSLTATGRVITISAAGVTGGDNSPWSPSLRSNLQIFVPRKADLKLQTRHGQVTVDGREGQIEVNAAHGSVTLRDIKGNTRVSLSHGDLRVENLTGDLTAEGRVDDTVIADVSGMVSLTGDFFGETRLARIAKGMRFSSSRTEMETGKVEGELRMDSGDLRASDLAGLKIHTRSKDIHLENISGNVEVSTKNASVELHADKSPLGNISINNDRGPIQLYLPEGATVLVQANTSGGDIDTDFEELKVETSGREAKLSGAIGTPGSRSGKVQLSTEHGDIEIRKRG